MFRTRSRTLACIAIVGIALSALPFHTSTSAHANPQISPGTSGLQTPDPDWAALGESTEPFASTEFSNTFDLGEGFRATEISPTPINYETGAGGWATIPTELVEQPDGTWSVPSNPLDPTFAETSDDHAVASFSNGGYSLSFSLVEGESSNFSARATGGRHREANEAIYRDVFEGVDLSYEVSASAVKETLVLQDVPLPGDTSWTWDISAPGLNLVKSEDGEIKFKDTSGETIFRIPAPVMWDSSGQAGLREAAEHPVDTTISNIDDGWRLVLHADKSWLTDTSRVYPVFVDPTTTLGDSNLKAWKSDGATRTDMVHVGNSRDSNTNKIWRTQVKYAYTPLFGKQVLDATISATYQSGSTASFTGSINTSSCTGYDCVGTKLGNLVVDTDGTASPDALGEQLATWVNNETEGKSILIRGSEASTYTYKALNTTLKVLWREFPKVTSIALPSPATGSITTTRPSLNVNISNSGGGTAQVRYTVSTSSSVWTTVAHQSPWMSPGAYTLPHGILVPGVRYYWSAEVKDSYDGVNGTSTVRKYESSSNFIAQSSAPVTPTEVTIANHDIVNTIGESTDARPLASAQVFDADGGNLTTEFQLFESSDSNFTTIVASCSSVIVNEGLAQCELAPGVAPNIDYVVRARTSDGDSLTPWANSADTLIELDNGIDGSNEDLSDLAAEPEPDPVSFEELAILANDSADGQDVVEDQIGTSELNPEPIIPPIPTGPGGTSPMMPNPSAPVCETHDETEPDGQVVPVTQCSSYSEYELTAEETEEAVGDMLQDDGPFANDQPLARGAAFEVKSPSWCTDAKNKVMTTRFKSCSWGAWEWKYTQESRGTKTVVATASGLHMHYLFVDDDFKTIGSQFSFLIQKRSGTLAGVFINAVGACSNCTSGISTFPTTSVFEPKWVYGEYYPESNVATGEVKRSKVYWKPRFVVPGATTTSVFNSHSLTTRCDKVYAGAAGCVMSGYVPSVVYKSTAYPEFTQHVLAAQASGLPGATRANPLSRKWGSTLATASRKVACPSSSALPRPTNHSCDEYPFASTYEGAKRGDRARTFNFCHISPVTSRTGSSGFSRCMIDEDHNTDAGNALKKVYRELRLLDKDKFFVTFN